jgi:dolichol-phosphate mannosyltransferase
MRHSHHFSISVIVPVFNNSVTINRLAEHIANVLRANVDSFEIILIDDGSTDHSWQLICNLSESIPECVGIRLSRNFGQHRAINAGLKRACGDLTVLMDADMKNSPDDIPSLLAEFASKELDIVLVEWDDGKPSRITSRIFHHLFNRNMKSPEFRKIATFRLFTAEVRRMLLEYPEVAPVYGPLMHQLGLRRSTVRLSGLDEPGDRSRYTFRKRLSLAWPMLLLVSKMPIKILVVLGMVIGGGSTIGLGIVATRFIFLGGNIVSTYSLIALFAFSLLGLILVGLAVVLLYLLQILREVQRRPQYHIMETVGSGLESIDRTASDGEMN